MLTDMPTEYFQTCGPAYGNMRTTARKDSNMLHPSINRFFKTNRVTFSNPERGIWLARLEPPKNSDMRTALVLRIGANGSMRWQKQTCGPKEQTVSVPVSHVPEDIKRLAAAEMLAF